jgi:hypothetical protein
MDQQKEQDGSQGNASDKRMAANRQNAQASTGPRSAEGKAVVRQNALKHGLTASNVIVPGLEDGTEYDNLLSRLIEDRKPQGILEEKLIEEIAFCLWQQARGARFQVDKTLQARDDQIFRTLSEQAPHIPLVSQSQVGREFGANLQLLADCLNEVEAAGELQPTSQHLLLSTFEDDGELHHLLGVGGLDGTEKNSRISTLLNSRMKLLQQCIAACDGKRKINFLRLASPTLPSQEDLNLSIRYDTANGRRLHRALDRLERLQRQRKLGAGPENVSIGEALK